MDECSNNFIFGSLFYHDMGKLDKIVSDIWIVEVQELKKVVQQPNFRLYAY